MAGIRCPQPCSGAGSKADLQQNIAGLGLQEFLRADLQNQGTHHHLALCARLNSASQQKQDPDTPYVSVAPGLGCCGRRLAERPPAIGWNEAQDRSPQFLSRSSYYTSAHIEKDFRSAAGQGGGTAIPHLVRTKYAACRFVSWHLRRPKGLGVLPTCSYNTQLED